ncbi:MAG TPA: hypothetical protein VLV15_02065 [Dongiaceae bacterium]|nr:hypothetical protein [Dongiaceae bacterium]
MGRPSTRGRRPVRAWERAACVALLVVSGGAIPVAARAGSADAPIWLRDPLARGPLSATAAMDDRWTTWSLDTGLPLGGWREPSRTGPGADDVRRARSSLTLSLAGVFDRHAGDAGTLRGAAIAGRGSGLGGGWLGLSTGAGAGGGDPAAPLRLAVGGWRTLAPVQVELGVVTSVVELVDPGRWFEVTHTTLPALTDSTPSRDSTSDRAVDHAAVWTTGQGALRWRIGRVELETITGVTVGDDAPMRRWAQGTVRVQLSRRLLLMASAGRRPAPSLAFDVTAVPRTMIGVQFAPWASSSWAMVGGIRPRARSWNARALPGERMAIHLRCQDTHMVELAADFTDWAPVALSPIGDGWWELVTAAGPGLHHVRVRLDHGGWLVPPGLPRAVEYPEPTGVLLVD